MSTIQGVRSLLHYLLCMHLKQRFNNHRTSTTTSIANTHTAQLGLLLTQNPNERSHNAGAASTKWVSQRNSTAMDINLVLLQAQKLQVSQRNNAERLVDFERVDGALLDAGVFQGLGDGERGGGGEFAGCLGGVAPAENLGDGLDVEFL